MAMRCPKCGNREKFLIEYSSYASVDFEPDGDGDDVDYDITDDDGDVCWDHSSHCECRECSHTATVFDFEANAVANPYVEE